MRVKEKVLHTPGVETWIEQVSFQKSHTLLDASNGYVTKPKTQHCYFTGNLNDIGLTINVQSK